MTKNEALQAAVESAQGRFDYIIIWKEGENYSWAESDCDGANQTEGKNRFMWKLLDVCHLVEKSEQEAFRERFCDDTLEVTHEMVEAFLTLEEMVTRELEAIDAWLGVAGIEL